MVGRQWPRPGRSTRPRLDVEEYARLGAVCSVTIAVRDRKPLFADPALPRAAVEVLLERSRVTGVSVYGYCVMPDHVHLVLGPSTRCDVITFVGQFKNLAQRMAWQRGIRGRIWQESFWDHFLRADEQVERVVEYVLNNPVWRSLATSWREYPFAGSLVFEL